MVQTAGAWRRRLVAVVTWGLAVGAPVLGHGAPPPQPAVLVAYDSTTWPSIGNMLGIAEGLQRQGIPWASLDVAEWTLTASVLEPFVVVVLSDLWLDAAERAAVAGWVASGGGLLATGSSGIGLEDVLGLALILPKTWGPMAPLPEVRFEVEHPVSHGAYWVGPSMSTPPTPAEALPMVAQFIYPNTAAPAYAVVPAWGTVVGWWFEDAWVWGSGRQEPAMVVSEHGLGRAVYSGALPGAWRDFNWPRCWQVFVVNAVEWLSARGVLVELGLWPDAHLSSLVWTGDVSLPEMVWAVPAVLDLFEQLGLERFGTFYLTARTGGAPGFIGIEEHPDLVGLIAAAGSEVAGHGDVHSGFSGLTLSEQKARLVDMVSVLDPLLAPWGEVCRGFRAPFVDFDTNTLRALGELGLYDSSDMQEWTETSFPHFAGWGWEAPPAGPMDYEVFTLWNLSEADAEASFRDRLDSIHAKRGMYPWLCHPEFIAAGHLGVLENVLGYAQALGTVWLTRQDDLLEWWTAREALDLAPVLRSPGKLEVTVHNSGPGSAAGVSIWVRLAEGSSSTQVLAGSSSGLGLEVVQRRHNGMEWVAVVLPSLLSGATEVVDLRLSLFADGFETGDSSRWGGGAAD